MNSIFSPTLWWIFFQRIINVLYPVNVICFLFLAYLALEPLIAALARRFFRKRIPAIPDDSETPVRLGVFNTLRGAKGLSLVLAILACDLLARMIPFFAGIPFSHRYLYPFALMSTLFAAIGLTTLSDSLWRQLSRKFTKLSKNNLLLILLSIVFLAYAGKSLRPRFDKKWLLEVPKIIRAETPKGEEAILFTNYLDMRLEYYSGAELRQCYPKNDYIIVEAIYPKNGNNFMWRTASKGAAEFKKQVRELGDRAFLLVRRKRKEQDVVSAEISPIMRNVATFSDGRRKWVFSLYQGLNGKERKMRINKMNSQ